MHGWWTAGTYGLSLPTNSKTPRGGAPMTSKTPHLQVVSPNSKAPRKEPKNITEALGGSGRDVLVAMRKALAKKLDDDAVASNSIASAYKELRELDRLIRLAEADEDEGKPTGDVDNGYDASAI